MFRVYRAAGGVQGKRKRTEGTEGRCAAIATGEKKWRRKGGSRGAGAGAARQGIWHALDPMVNYKGGGDN